jgi:nucleotide-binding universal stress UspA family protein
MQTGRTVLLYPAAPRTPWYLALAIATSEVASHLALTLAIVAAGVVVVAAVLLLLAVATPLGGALVLWIVWRSAHDGGREARRLARRAQRRARALGLRVANGTEP